MKFAQNNLGNIQTFMQNFVKKKTIKKYFNCARSFNSILTVRYLCKCFKNMKFAQNKEGKQFQTLYTYDEKNKQENPNSLNSQKILIQQLYICNRK